MIQELTSLMDISLDSDPYSIFIQDGTIILQHIMVMLHIFQVEVLIQDQQQQYQQQV